MIKKYFSENIKKESFLKPSKLFFFLMVLVSFCNSAHAQLNDNTPGAGKVWAVPAGVTSVTTTAWGAGGGGGGSSVNSLGGNGGGGGGATSSVISVTGGITSFMYTVGTGGTAGAAGAGAGGNGGLSTITCVVPLINMIANGGTGGLGNAAILVTPLNSGGGTAMGGTTNQNGLDGIQGGTSGQAGGNSGTVNGIFGAGGGAKSNSIGNPGSVPGGGGGGGEKNGGTNRAGGAGGNGQVSFQYIGVTGISPNPACVGSTITITGFNFASGVSTVTVNGTSCTGVTYVNSTTLTAVVASGTTTGTVVVTNANGTNDGQTLTVSANNTAGVASSTPTLCINTPLTDITHTTTGATGISNAGVPGANGLPASVSATWASNTITISGTPTASGTFNYSIPLTGGCGSVNATGTITVNINNTSGAASSAPTLCVNTALTSITHSTTGATGISNDNVAGANGLPAGVSAQWATNTITITGTPTASGVFAYTIPITGGCGSVNATGIITVTTANTVGSASSTPTLCINTAVTAITHATSGATGISDDGVSGTNGLPTGIFATWASNTITISGTPTIAGTFNYSIPLTGGCGNVNASGTITVLPDNTVNIASSTATLCINTPLTAIIHTTTGATGISNDGISGANGLPTGVFATWASDIITISGTPTTTGVFNYSIPLTGGCDSLNATGIITVTSGDTVSAPSSTPILCVDTVLTAVTHTTTGATGISDGGVSGVNGLPAGVSATWASDTITINGIPTASGIFNYSIPLTGGCGNINATGTITVLPDNGAGAPSSTPALCANTALTAITQTTTGATGILDDGIAGANGLPAGVSATWASDTITISGTPTASGIFNYSIPSTGGCGNVNATGTITVDNAVGAAGAISGLTTVCQGQNGVIYSVPSIINATDYNWTLPFGTTIVSGTNTDTITVDFSSAATTGDFTVLGVNSCGNGTISSNYTITVNVKPTIDLTSAVTTDSQTICVNTILTDITYTIGGSATGATVIGLPTGVVGTFAAGVLTISGTPTDLGLFNYTVTASGGLCPDEITTGTITVDSLPTINLTSALATTNQALCINTALTDITYSIGGNATGASVSGLPAGVNGNYAVGIFTISGIPTASGTFNYTVTTTGGACSAVTASGTVTVDPLPTISLTSAGATDNQTICINTILTNITYSIGGTATGASVIGLPAGVIGNYAAGVFTISGTPTASGTFNYTVTSSGGLCADAVISGTITVDPLPTVILTSAGTTNNQTICINTIVTDITYNIGGSATGATVSNLPAGVNGNFAAGVFTISGTPIASGTFNYTVTTTGGTCSGITATGTLTVNPLPDNAGAVSGTSVVCQGQDGVAYSVPTISNATGYVWILPPGATIVAGTNTRTIVVDYAPTASSGNITVQGTNACGNGIVSADFAVSVSIAPLISINYDTTVCSGELVTITPIDGGGNVVPPGTTYSWSLPTVTGGMSGATSLSNQASFNQTLTNITNVQQSALYTVTASTGGCSASTFSVMVYVDSEPTIDATPLTQTICSGTSITDITFSNPNAIAGTIDYNWTRDNNVNISGLSASGNGDTITGILINNTNTPQTTVFNVIATTVDGCDSVPFTVLVTVNPIPTLAAAPVNQTTCSEDNITAIALSNPNNVIGTTYSWTRDNTGFITGISDGSGTSISGSLTNTTNTVQTTVFSILASANGCHSVSTTVSVTVNPKPTVAVSLATQTVCGNIAIDPIIITNPNTVAGTTYSWTRDNIFNLTGVANSGSSTPISGTFMNNTNSDQTAVFTITATAGTCSSAITSSVIVKPTPTIAVSLASQTKCNATAINTINITNPNSLPGTTFIWSRDKTTELTGIASNSSGNSITGTLTNTTNVTQTSTFTITATAANGCSSISTATVTIYAPLSVPTIGTAQSVCTGNAPDILSFSTPSTGGSGIYTYQWQSSSTNTGFTVYNDLVGETGSTYQPPALQPSDENTSYKVIVTDSLCGTVTSNGVVIEVINNNGLTIKLANTPSGPICTGSTTTPGISVKHHNTSAVKMYWSSNSTYFSPAIGGPIATTDIFNGNGTIDTSGNIGPITVSNNTNASITSAITISTEVYDYDKHTGIIGAFLCNAQPQIVNITILPTPVASASVPNTTICNSSSTGIVISGNIIDASTTFNWSRNSNTNVTSSVSSGTSGVIAPGATYTIPDVLSNTSAIAQNVIYTITPVSNGCSGSPITVTITIIPTVTSGTVLTDQTICNAGDPATFTESVAATGINLSYQWQSSTVSASGPWANIGGTIATTYNVPSGLTLTTWYQRVVTSTLNGVTCSVANVSPVKVTVNTVNAGSISGDQTICFAGDPNAFTSVAATGVGTITYQWYSNTTGCGGAWTLIAGATSDIYDIPSGLTTTTYYRREVVSTLNSVSCSSFSNCLTITINNITSGTVATGAQVCGNDPAAFTQSPAATGSGVLTYQWQKSTTGCAGTWTNSTGSGGVTVANYNPPAGVIITTDYRRIVTSTLNGVQCTATSNCITVTPNIVTAGAISGNRTVCEGGDPAAFTQTTAATVTGPDLIYKWQSSLTGGAPWTDISGANANVYDEPEPVTQRTYYRRVASSTVNGLTCIANSTSVSVFVNIVTTPTVAGDQMLCSNLNPAAFTVPVAATVTGGGTLSHQWKSNTVGCGGAWSNIAGATNSTTYDPLTIAQTTYYQLVATSILNGVACVAPSNCITVTNLSKSWNGSVNNDWNTPVNWTPSGVPDASNCVIIPDVPNDPVISGTNYQAFAFNLTILTGGNLIADRTNAITVTDIVTVNTGGQFIIKNDASLIQINSVTNSGNITYERTAVNIKGSDYVYWSSPVNNQALGSIYTTPTQGPKYEWNTLVNNGNGAFGNISQGNWANTGAIMQTAKGYLVRGSSSYSMAASNINSTFVGVPNNGNISIAVYRGSYTGPNYNGANGSTITKFDDNQNLLGNPYPSSINALQFLSDNSAVILGNLSLWTHGTSPSTGTTSPYYGSFTYNYTSNDYVTINFTGSTIPSISDIVKTGQAFFVQMLDGPAGTGTVNFTNSLRKDASNTPYTNSGFFKTVNTKIESFERHRIWLDIVDSNKTAIRTLVGYATGATLGTDQFYDASKKIDGNINFYSLIGDEAFTIQGRPLPFDSNDVVPLGFKVAASGVYNIAINTTDGLFETIDQSIYLEDKDLGVIHDLKTTPYSFTATPGIYNNRFVLRYSNDKLGITNPNDAANLTALIHNRKISVQASENITEIQVFDIAGKLIKTYTPKEITTKFEDDFVFANGIYISKIKLDNDSIVTQKLANGQ